MKTIFKSEKIEQPKQLLESQQWYSTIFEHSPIAIGISRLSDSQFVDVNPALIDMLGYSRQELLGHTPRELQIGANLGEGQRLLEILKTEAHANNFETVICNKSGELLDVSIAAQIVEIGDEKCLLAQIVDITARKQTEKALKLSRATLRSFYDSAPFMMGIAELDGDKIVAVSGNRATADFFATSVKNLPGHTGRELGTPEKFEQLWMENYLRCQQEGTPVRFEYEVPHASGRRWLLATAAFIGIGAAGNPQFSFVVEDTTARKRVDEALRESEERYRSLVDSSMDAVILSAADGGILSANVAACRMFGRSEQELIRLGRSGIVDVSDPKTAAATKERDRSGKFTGELTFLRSDGTTFPGEVSVATFRTRDGELRASSIIRDITEHKKTEEALRESKIKLSAVIENLPVGIWMVDAAGRVTAKNAAADQIWAGDAPLSSSQEAYLKYPTWDVKTGKRLDADDYPLTKTIRTGLPIPPVELRIRRFDGTAGIILMSTVPLRNPDGSLTGAVGINIDITERKRAEEALQKMNAELGRSVTKRTAELRTSDARFRSIFMDSPLGMALLNPSGEILASNPALQKMLGYNEEQLKGKLFDLYSHHDDAADDATLHKALLSVEAGHYRAEKRFVRMDGQVRWSELTMSRIPARNGEAGFAFAMLEDITEQKLDQEALLKSERLAIIGRLGASLAHEINNPLQAALGCLGLAEETIEDGIQIKNYLKIAMEELDRAAGIVSHLRDLGRPAEPEKKELTNLNTIMEKTLIMTRKRCENQSVQVKWKPAANLPLIPVVVDNIQQVFLNLVLNAVEAMNKGGVLQIMTGPTHQPAGIFVTVADNGLGIEPARLRYIFEPFHSTRPTGMGLGLYISKKIVDSHNGRIEVDSQPGAGSTFTIWLPG